MVTLEQGDLLYLPRGFIHEAATGTAAASTHVTISTYQKHSWGELLRGLLPAALETAMEEDSDFRRGLPMGFLHRMGTGQPRSAEADQMAAWQGARALLKRLAKHVTLPLLHETADKMAQDFMVSRLPPPGADSHGPAAAQAGTGGVMPMGLAPHEAGAVMRLSYPRSMRLSIEMSPHGEPLLSILHSVKNSRRGHMGVPGGDSCVDEETEEEGDEEEDEEEGEEEGEEEEEDEEDEESDEDGSNEDDSDEGDGPDSSQCLTFPGSYGGVVNHLMEHHPNWFALDHIPLAIGMQKKDRLALLMELWWAGLLEVAQGAREGA